MISKKTAVKLQRSSLELPPIETVAQLNALVKLHCALGFDDLEVFCTRKSSLKLLAAALNKGFYANTKAIKSTDDNLLYLSWSMS
jgi:hypothetical protein